VDLQYVVLKTTSPTVWLATFVRQRLGANMKSLNASPARWVGVLALLCAFLALITPAGKQAVHFDAIDHFTRSEGSTQHNLADNIISLSEREEGEFQDLRSIRLLQA
jgi:hypothetical protein